MRAYINDDGQPTIEIPRLVEQPKLVSINTIVDDIVARTEPPKRYQKLLLERSLIGILHAFEIYIAKMLVADGWCNGDSEFVDVKDVWSDTHTVRHIDKDGTLCIGGCDGKGRKFVNKLKRNGWIDSFIACYDGADHPEIRVFFLPAGIPPKLKVLDWWDSNKVKFKQGHRGSKQFKTVRNGGKTYFLVVAKSVKVASLSCRVIWVDYHNVGHACWFGFMA